MPQQAIEKLPIDKLVGPNGLPLDRGNEYGEQYFQQHSLDRLADEGSLFLVKNATKGTGVTATNNGTQVTTLPFIFGSVPGGLNKRSVRPHRLYLRAVGIGTTWATINIDVITSIGGSYTSGGTSYLVNGSGLTGVAAYRNLRSSRVDVSSVMDNLYFGVPTVVLGSNPRQVASFTPRPGTIPVAGDEYIINFGSLMGDLYRQDVTTIPAGTTVNRYVTTQAPFIVDPGCQFMVVVWGGSMAGTVSFEWDLLWSER